MITGLIKDLAIYTKCPEYRLEEFDTVEPVRVGEKTEIWLDGIDERAYYTNHGPLVSRYETAVAACAGVAHVIAITNRPLAVAAVLVAMEIQGNVLLPALTPTDVIEGVHWAGLQPVFCDYEPGTYQIDSSALELTDQKPGAVVLNGLLNIGCISEQFRCFCKMTGVPLLMFDSRLELQIIAQRNKQFDDITCITSVCSPNRCIPVPDGLVLTSDDGLAERLRAVRSFHKNPHDELVGRRINGKISEIQAAQGLIALNAKVISVEQTHVHFQRNEYLRSAVRQLDGLCADIGIDRGGIYLFVLLESAAIGVAPDRVSAILRSEGIPAVCCGQLWYKSLDILRSVHPGRKFPVAMHVLERALRLPAYTHPDSDYPHKLSQLLKICFGGREVLENVQVRS